MAPTTVKCPYCQTPFTTDAVPGDTIAWTCTGCKRTPVIEVK
jgi:hypothetical protein